MSRLMSHILLAILMLPLATVVYIVTLVVYMELISDYDPNGFAYAGVVAWAFVGTYWWLLWRRSVRWTTERTIGTLGAVVVAAFCGVIVAFALSPIEEAFGICVGSMLAPLLWLVATIFLWRESAAERAERLTSSGKTGVVCPSCGYNLTGLNGTRCPECGTQYTLDELMAAQPGRSDAEIVGS